MDRRCYPAEVVAGVRALVEIKGLEQREAAARFGLHKDTVSRWARRFGWRRGCGHSPWRHDPAVVEAARERIEGTRVAMARIGQELGVSVGTLYRWIARYRWRRAAPPERVGPGGATGPTFYRSRRLGRPYGADAVGTARDLVQGSSLTMRRVAARAGVDLSTLYDWKRRRGWTRHPALATGRRHHPPYPPGVVAAARQLYCTTRLPTRLVAARVGATHERVATWARTGGWTRPRDGLDPDGRLRRAGRRASRA